MGYNSIIYNILSNNAGVAGEVGNRIYPVAAEQTATTPYIVFRHSITPTDVKGYTTQQDTITIEINAVSDSVDTSNDIAAAIRTALDQVQPGNVEGHQTREIVFQGQGFEMYNDELNEFIVPSTYTIKITKL